MLGFSLSKTMKLAQDLYTGGYISYMRTDSPNISVLAQNNCKQYLLDTYGEVYSAPKNFAAKASNSQEAHEAIRPTDVTFKADELSLSQDHKKLYNLIWSRFVASQMPQPEIIVNSIKAQSETNIFETSVSSISFDGFYKVMPPGKNSGYVDYDLESLSVGLMKKINNFDVICKKLGIPIISIRKIEKSLKKFNGKIYIVGGNVRDLILNRSIINHPDLVVNLDLEKLLYCFEKAKIRFLKIGEKLGSIVVLHKKFKFDVTVMRKDIKTDGRWAKIKFTDSLEEDSKRRDFTFNSIYCDTDGHLADPNKSKTRSRRAFGFVYHGVSAKHDKQKEKIEQEQLKAELKSKNKL